MHACCFCCIRVVNTIYSPSPGWTPTSISGLFNGLKKDTYRHGIVVCVVAHIKQEGEAAEKEFYILRSPATGATKSDRAGGPEQVLKPLGPPVALECAQKTWHPAKRMQRFKGAPGPHVVNFCAFV